MKFEKLSEKLEGVLDVLASLLESVFETFDSLNTKLESVKRKHIRAETSYYGNRQTLTAPTESMGRDTMEVDCR